MEVLSTQKREGNLAFFLFEGKTYGLPSSVKRLLEFEKFEGKKGEVKRLSLNLKRFKVVYLVGLGKREDFSEEVLRYSCGELARRLEKDDLEEITLVLSRLNKRLTKSMVEGILLGLYNFKKYKKEDEKENKLKRILIYKGDEEGIKLGKIFAEAQNFARDLINEPGNVLNPITLAKKCEEVAKEKGLECKIYDERQILEMGMNALYAVAKGSETPPRFVHLTYRPEGRPKGRIVLVGKGLTFDSGGLNIKPDNYMRTMKMDKSGACVVLAVMGALRDLKVEYEVHGVMALAENMPSGKAYRPDDIIVAKNKKSIEVDNTDAEGRITLADALSYASELKPDKIIDLATLTGACMVALGEYTAGLFGNNQNLIEELLKISKMTGERMWQLPLDDERLRKKIRSKVADLLNTGGRYGGAITAAMFLEEFVEKGIRWAHLDIAGPAWSKEEYGYYKVGATGFGVRSLLEYLLK